MGAAFVICVDQESKPANSRCTVLEASCHQEGNGGAFVDASCINDPQSQDLTVMYEACCKPNMVDPASSKRKVQSLSYAPNRFEDEQTTDASRSHERYGNVIVHDTRGWDLRRPKIWKSWLQYHTAGWPVTLLGPYPTDVDYALKDFSKIPATCYFDRALTRLTVFPHKLRDSDIVLIDVDSLQVICAATDFMPVLVGAESCLDNSEKNRSVLIHFVMEETQRKRIVFIMDTEHTKARFLQALTGLWLEKRVDRSVAAGRANGSRIHLSV